MTQPNWKPWLGRSVFDGPADGNVGGPNGSRPIGPMMRPACGAGYATMASNPLFRHGNAVANASGDDQ